MAASNEQLVIKIRGIAENLPKIVDDAGKMLASNVRKNINRSLKSSHKYPFELKSDFKKDSVIYYDQSEKAVIVDHPAAKRLEYGLGQIKIVPKNGEFIRFVGRDGEEVYVKEVTIKATEPLGYAISAIRETKKEFVKKFKEVINE